jgi:hypothetical protein
MSGAPAAYLDGKLCHGLLHGLLVDSHRVYRTEPEAPVSGLH